MIKRLLAIAFLTFAIAAPASAQFTSSAPPPAVSVAPQPTAVGVTTPGAPVIVAQQTDYTFSTGNFVASLINWMWVAFGTAIATLVTGLVYKALSYLGIQTTTQQREQLQSIVVNGLNKASAQAQVAAQGQTQWDVRIKNQIVADTVKYAQDHGADTIKALGLDPKSGQAVEAIKARIETAIVDPATPTNDNIKPGITINTPTPVGAA